MIFWLVPESLTCSRVVLLATPVFLTINGFLSLALVVVVWHTLWEVLDVGLLSHGKRVWLPIFPVLLLLWFIGVIHKLLWYSNKGQNLVSFGSLVDHPPDLRRLLYLFRATAVTYYLVDYLSYSLFILLLYMQSLKSEHEYENNMFNFRLIFI